MLRFTFLLASGFLYSSFAFAYQASAPAAAGSEGDGTVTLNVVVNDKSGNPISGLEEQDFAVRENKQRQRPKSDELNGCLLYTSNPNEVTPSPYDRADVYMELILALG